MKTLKEITRQESGVVAVVGKRSKYAVVTNWAQREGEYELVGKEEVGSVKDFIDRLGIRWVDDSEGDLETDYSGVVCRVRFITDGPMDDEIYVIAPDGWN